MGWFSITVCFLIAAAYIYNFLSTRKKSSSIVATNIPSIEGIAPTEKAQPNVPEVPVNVTQVIPEIATPLSVPELTTKQLPTMSSSHEDQASNSSGTMMAPPSLPSSNRISSSTSMNPPRLRPPIVGPAPPRPGGSSLHPPPSAASSLRVPPQKVLQNTSMQPASLTPNSQKKTSRQVALEPGHSPMDWAALTADPNNKLRGKDAPIGLTRVTPSQLKLQNGRKGRDVWTVYQGKVYNISPYVPFHPGGKGEILRGAGKDSGKLFMEVHPWVNWDGMLAECMIGILVGEEEKQRTNELDEMD